jgi:hypothetical protein
MQKGDVQIDTFDEITVEFEHKAQYSVCRRVLRPKIHCGSARFACQIIRLGQSASAGYSKMDIPKPNNAESRKVLAWRCAPAAMQITVREHYVLPPGSAEC